MTRKTAMTLLDWRTENDWEGHCGKSHRVSHSSSPYIQHTPCVSCLHNCTRFINNNNNYTTTTVQPWKKVLDFILMSLGRIECTKLYNMLRRDCHADVRITRRAHVSNVSHISYFCRPVVSDMMQGYTCRLEYVLPAVIICKKSLNNFNARVSQPTALLMLSLSSSRNVRHEFSKTVWVWVTFKKLHQYVELEAFHLLTGNDITIYM